MKPCVSVIVPSYNRANILEETIPTYLQPEVAELILVDDCSQDDTPEVVAKLQKKFPQIKYYRNECNLRQTGTQNRALQYVTQQYIYFGDDDSVLLPGTINHLLTVMHEYKADVVAAIPIYADEDKDMDDLPALIERKAPKIKNLKDKVDIAHLERCDFFFTMDTPQAVPFTNACALVKRMWIDKAHFDTNFGGNSYREETDYWLQMSEQKARIYYAASAKAAQINLPFSRINRHRTFRSMWRHGKYDIINTIKLIDKHYEYFRKYCGYQGSKTGMKVRYVFNDCLQYACIFPGRILGMVKKRLGE